MKNKERLLDLREPVRFIFSHSALKEGWDNPNVFQICTLKIVVLKSENGRRLAGGFASVSTTMANGWTQTFLPGMSIQSMF